MRDLRGGGKNEDEEAGAEEEQDLGARSMGFARPKKILKKFAKAVDSGMALPYFQTVIGP